MSSIWGIGPDSLTGGREGFFRKEPIIDFLDFIVPFRVTDKKQKNLFIAEKLAELSKKMPAIAKAVEFWEKEQVDLSNYSPYLPVQDISLEDAPELIEAELRQRKNQQNQRILELQKLVTFWGIELDGSLSSLDALELWFCKYVHIFTKDEFEKHLAQYGDDKGENHIAEAVWYSIVMDISMYMYDMLKKDVPGCRWCVTPTTKSVALCYCKEEPEEPKDFIEFESSLWALMITLRNKYIPNRFFDDMSREYKQARKQCRKTLRDCAR